MKIQSKLHIFSLVLLILLHTGCSQESPSVNPFSFSTTPPSSEPGTDLMQSLLIYPINDPLPAGIFVPVDSNIIIAFSMEADASTIAANVTINNGAAYPAPVTDGRIITLNPAVDLLYGTDYTITVTTGVTSTSGETLDQIYTWYFTTEAAVSPGPEDPRVISGTQFPASGVTDIDFNIPYIETTFSIEVMNVTTATFTLVQDPLGVPVAVGGTSITQVAGTNTWRLNLSSNLLYGTKYEAQITTAITDLTGNPLVNDAGPLTWQFDTEADPYPAGAVSITDIWIGDVTDTGATVHFNTDRPVAKNLSYLVYDTSPLTIGTTGTAVQENAAADLTDFHTIVVPDTTLSSSTVYYYRVLVDTAAPAGVDAGDTFPASDSTFITESTSGSSAVNLGLSESAGAQTFPELLQFSDGSFLVTWITAENGDTDIYSEYFNSTAVRQWGSGVYPANGVAVINDTANHPQNSFKTAIIDESSKSALVVYNDESATDYIYGKAISDSAGISFSWSQTSASQGVNLDNSEVLGTNPTDEYSVTTIGANPPVIIMTRTSDMPNDGTPANLIFDKNTDFSLLGGLDVNDLLLYNTGGTGWSQALIANQGAAPADNYQHVLITDAVTNLDILTNYYIADADVTVSGNSNSNMPPGAPYTFDDSLLGGTGTMGAGDIIKNNADNMWGIIVSIAGVWPDFTFEVDRDIDINNGEGYIIYKKITGPATSQKVYEAPNYYPLWDDTSAFAPGTTVLENDIVVNENNNTTPAQYAAVVTPDPTKDSDTAIRLDTDIMDDSDGFSIIRMDDNSSITLVGYTGAEPAGATLTDPNIADYTVAGVNPGDIVFNIDDDLSATVLSVSIAPADTLSLSSDIFSGTNDKYIIYKKNFFLAYINTSGDVIGKTFSTGSGSIIGSAITIDNSSSFTQVSVLSNDGDSIIAVYGDGSTLHAKGFYADKSLKWTDSTIFTGTNIRIIKLLPSVIDSSIYLLADEESGSGNVSVIKLSDSTSGAAWTSTFTGHSPDMIIDDTTAGTAERVIVTYKNLHTVALNNYYHIEARALSGTTGAADIAAYNVTSNTVAYNCQNPDIEKGDTSTNSSAFYISWFDGRYYAFTGYSLFTRLYSTTGGVYDANWASELYVAVPESIGTGTELFLRTGFWDDGGGDPGGVIPIWLDYRNTASDIFYELVRSNATY